MSGGVEVEDNPDLLVCYQLTTIGHLLPAGLTVPLAHLCVPVSAINSRISCQVYM